MSTRRNAFRLNLGRPGILHFDDHEATCLVVDISATGARVRLKPPTLVPDRFSLETTVADHTVEMDAHMIRSDENSEIAMVFDNPEHRYLHKLLHEEQRRIIASGVRATVDRRWEPRDGEDESDAPDGEDEPDAHAEPDAIEAASESAAADADADAGDAGSAVETETPPNPEGKPLSAVAAAPPEPA